jgi:hypothetical protein
MLDGSHAFNQRCIANESLMKDKNSCISPSSLLVITSVNPDCQVNYGCNLKWKPADKSQDILALVTNFRQKIASKSLK